MRLQYLFLPAVALLILVFSGCAASTPAISVGSDSTSLTAPPASMIEEMRPYSVAERKQIFKESLLAEDRGTNEAISRIPKDIMKQIDLEQELKIKYKAMLAKKYGLTYDQLQEIGYEGVLNSWPTK